MTSNTSRSAEPPLFSSSPSTSTKPTSVDSKQQPEDFQTIRFTNVHDLFRTIDHTTEDFLAITHVSPGHFTDIERERDRRRRKFRLRRYNSDSNTLFITIPTQAHEKLHTGIYEGYRDQLVRSGTESSWDTVASVTYRAKHNHPGGDGGEGDSTGGPMPERGAKGAWPTLVVEAGVSESLNQLHNDMRWWFAASDHDVKIVLLAKFDHARDTIILEKWEEEARGTRPGAATTRYLTAVEPVRRQAITITQDLTTDPISYPVTSGALVLGFRLLFLREPGPGEGDFVLSVQKLQAWAERVWKVV
ncbi:uncharacterized protein C8A04DRAFT_12682 [Dichotomopilus funicola]|uniref:Uncharacterized protein n=1 Tax=Dichotomopilus funicola TaxID=1934379 RepID=A0AAN6ZKX6_9PEZI|nr:hypothetical protein C8A04DRAFT_12682 [Dichotomopilus funicola]